MTASIIPTLDVREIPPGERHTRIFNRFDALAPGQAFLLLHDHDPLLLRHHFADRSSGHLEWTYLEAGPALWRVKIGRTLATAVAGDSCCSGGACCE
jgi:uncharacterized protein (DUF2249 family)